MSFILKGPSKAPIYLRIAETIREAIRSGRIRPGESIPSTRRIASDVEAHRHTVMTALDELVAEGWLIARPRRGYQVCETLPSRYFGVRGDGARVPKEPRHAWTLARQARLPELVAPDRVRFNFKSGIPDLRLFPHDELRSCISESLRKLGPKLMAYGGVEGHPPFVAELVAYLRRMRALSDRKIIVTHGSQEAIFLAAQLLVGPSDKVVVEEMGYPPAFGALRLAGAELLPVRVDAEGLDPDHLEAILRKQKVKLMYLTPLHQYPTTVTLSVSRRMRIYELACRHGVPILEDDYDHEYHYRCQPLTPMAADDPAGLVLYVSTFSKVFSPSSRLGFMAVPSALFQPLIDLKRLVSRQNDLLTQDALARWMRAGGFERHLRRTRRHYEERRDVLVECLERARGRGADLSFCVPDGGMAIWVRSARDSARVAQRAGARGVYVAHESEFRVSPAPGRGLRLGFANQNPREISAGMEQLLEALG